MHSGGWDSCTPPSLIPALIPAIWQRSPCTSCVLFLGCQQEFRIISQSTGLMVGVCLPIKAPLTTHLSDLGYVIRISNTTGTEL